MTIQSSTVTAVPGSCMGVPHLRQSSALLLSASASIVAAGFVSGAAFLLGGRLGAWQWVFYLGALLALAGGLYPFRQATWGSRLWMRSLLLRKLFPGDSAAETQDIPALPGKLAAMFEQRLEQVERRERELAERLGAYQQWFEFPPPLTLADARPASPQILERDRALDKLLEQKTQFLFERIRKNEYSPEGTFQFALVRDDVYQFVAQIAALYDNDPRQLLTGVSSERVLRAAGRCCVKFLVELDKLPLDIHTYDLVDVYTYIRGAVKVYGLYRSARPYMPWFRSAYYGTWLAMGSNPLTMGAWWFVSSLGTRGATTLATNIANRWALSFLHDIVRVIGYEVAAIYDRNLRYRDPNWCLAAELAEMVQYFPNSERSLRRALSLIGSLQFRNEYDRIFFFRLMVEGKRPGLNRAQASDLLPSQRREIANRLEGFLESYVTGASPKMIHRWRAGLEERLDIVLTREEPSAAGPAGQQRRDLIRSLAGYLLEIKQVEPETLQPLLQQTSLVLAVPREDLPGLWQGLQDDPPFFFQAPAILPAEPLLRAFVKDLVDLAVRVAPRYAVADEIVISTAVRLGGNSRTVKQQLDARYVDHLAHLLPKDAPNRRLPPEVARAVLDLVQQGEPLRLVYGDVQPVEVQPSDMARIDRSSTWLVGTGERLVAFALRDTPLLLWEGTSQVSIELIPGRLRGGCRIHGGRWASQEIASTPVLLLRSPFLTSIRRYFAPLQQFCMMRASEAEEELPRNR